MSDTSPRGFDVVQLWRRPRGNPFASTTVIASVCDLSGRLTGECFLLVENGKIFFSGRRIICPVSSPIDAGLDDVRGAAHELLSAMARTSRREGVKAAPPLDLPVGFEPVDLDLLLHLCQQPEYARFLRWLSVKAASPALRERLAASLPKDS